VHESLVVDAPFYQQQCTFSEVGMKKQAEGGEWSERSKQAWFNAMVYAPLIGVAIGAGHEEYKIILNHVL
jgi:hypothetical protein